MAEKEKRRFGDRKDAKLVRDADGMHQFGPYIYKNRTDREAFMDIELDIGKTMEFIAKKNIENPDYKYTLFHFVLTVVARVFYQRPMMNRFIKNRRIYQRNDILLAFNAKKKFTDEAIESQLFLKCDKETNIDSVNRWICEKLDRFRNRDKLDNTVDIMETIAKLPRFIIKIVAALVHSLDKKGWLPNSLICEDPHHASCYMSNLGSIKLPVGYHHINNFGTMSVFLVVGEIHKAMVYDKEGNGSLIDAVSLGITLDELIADGYYFSRTVKLIRYMFAHPELADLPIGEEVEYD